MKRFLHPVRSGRSPVPLLAGAVLLLTGAGCQSGTYRGAGAGLELQLAVDRDVLLPGETLTLRLSVRNPGRSPALLGHTGRGLDSLFGFRVEDFAGNVVSREETGGWGHISNAPRPIPWFLDGGDTLEREFRWTWDAEQVEPGPHRVFAGLGYQATTAAAEAEILLRAAPPGD